MYLEGTVQYPTLNNSFNPRLIPGTETFVNLSWIAKATNSTSMMTVYHVASNKLLLFVSYFLSSKAPFHCPNKMSYLVAMIILWEESFLAAIFARKTIFNFIRYAHVGEYLYRQL